MGDERAPRHPIGVLLALVTLTYLAALVVAPELVLRAFVKEGAVEHVGHLVLLAACAAWAWAAFELRGKRTSLLAVAGVIYLSFLLLEEIDYGAVYGVELISSPLRDRLGVPNLHNAQGDVPTMFLSALFWLAMPLAAFFATGFIPEEKTRPLAPLRPRRSDTIVFFVAAVLMVVFDSARLLELRLGEGVGRGVPESSALGLFQAVLYALAGYVAWRATRRS